MTYQNKVNNNDDKITVMLRYVCSSFSAFRESPQSARIKGAAQTRMYVWWERSRFVWSWKSGHGGLREPWETRAVEQVIVTAAPFTLTHIFPAFLCQKRYAQTAKQKHTKHERHIHTLSKIKDC